MFNKEDIIDALLYGLIILVTIIIMWLGVSFASDASTPHIPIAGIDKKLMNMVNKAERQVKYDAKIKQERLSQKRIVEETYQQKLRQVFGYVPSSDAIHRAKRVVMAEGGNTETIDGIEKIFEVIANRCRSNKFPNTIDEVIYQRNQFQTVMEGTIWKYNVNERVEQAWANLIERGYCADDQILFFTAGGYNPYCIPMYKFGNHYFGR